MSENKNRKSRVAAVALAVVGVAGLSMAAAAQLNLNFTGSFQAGAAAVNADCQTSTIAVTYAAPSFEASATVPWRVGKVTFDSVDATCNNKGYKAAYKLGSANWVEFATGTTATGKLTVDLPAGLDANTISQVALTIYG
ncbi:MAG: hypothetical protein AAGC63_04510 [Propionicimonas sp.]|nr:hypothetical protein [Propionicimonas sp.]